MTAKRVPLGLKPGTQKHAEEWVTQPMQSSATPPVEEVPPPILKRLTIDVPEELHRRLKVKAANEGVRMADLVRHWIEDGCI
jgi:hypothetical protein